MAIETVKCGVLPCSGKFAEVIGCAERYALMRCTAEGGPMLTVEHLFKAVTLVDRAAWTKTVGKVRIPQFDPPGDRRVDLPWRWSSEADRCLSWYGGILSEIMTDEDDCIDSIHVAKALLKRPVGEVARMLRINERPYEDSPVEHAATDATWTTDEQGPCVRVQASLEQPAVFISDVSGYWLRANWRTWHRLDLAGASRNEFDALNEVRVRGRKSTAAASVYHIATAFPAALFAL